MNITSMKYPFEPNLFEQLKISLNGISSKKKNRIFLVLDNFTGKFYFK